MPTKRTRISRAMVPGVSEVALHFLSDGLFPLPDNSENDAMSWRYFTTTEEKEKILAQCRDAIIVVWIEERPGTRPSWWWLSEAPEKARRRLGGIGDPAFEHLNYVETYDHVIPTSFIDQWSVDYYNGRARDINGKKVGDHNEGDFAGRAIDPADPPRYESEAAYLKRNGLLRPEETRHLRKKDFEPEIISVDDVDDFTE
jgi:hypothetical protein